MKSFPKPQDTLAGINQFWFIPVNQIATFGDIILNELQSLLLASGAEWLTAYSTYNSKEFTEKKKESKKGVKFVRSLVAFYPGFSQELIQQLEEMKLNQFLVAYKDYNDNYYIKGTPDNPLNFEYVLGTGKSGIDPQGVSLEFFGDSKIRMNKSTFEILFESSSITFDFTKDQAWSGDQPDGWNLTLNPVYDDPSITRVSGGLEMKIENI